jgi:hypothetical protein
MSFCTDDDIDDIDDVDLVDWDRIFRGDWTELEEWAKFLRAAFYVAVEEAEYAVFPKPRQLKDLLSSFILDYEDCFKPAIVYWTSSTTRAAAHEAAEDAKKSVDAERAKGDPGPAVESAALSAAAKLTDEVTVPGDAFHVSDAAIVFKSWEITSFPDEYDAPLLVPITDASIVENVKKARSMIQPIEHGVKGVLKKQPAGKLAWTPYGKKEGWMYVEPAKSDYGVWLSQRMKDEYDARMKAAKAAAADSTLSARRKNDLLASARVAASCLAVMRQEGAPSAINTYDGTVLTWGIGIAGPGRLPETFYRIVKDPNVERALYLCGFKYQGTPTHGAYQIVDLTSDPPRVVFRDNYAHKDRGTIKKGRLDYGAYKVLQVLVDQLELIYLLIALARDELTRETVFRANYDLVEQMVTLGDHAEIESEALFVFISEVKHNWNLHGDIAKEAIKRFDATEATLPKSPERDKAIAKGVFRYTMSAIQRAAWGRAVAELRVNVKQGKSPSDREVSLANVMHYGYGFDRLLDNYWNPMQKGTNTQDGSALPVPDFPAPMAGTTPGPDDIVVTSKKGAPPLSYVIGTQSQCDFLFPDPKTTLVDFDDGNIIVKDGKGNQWKVSVNGEKVP